MVKVINKRMIRNPEVLLNEVNILRKLDHPNIIKLYESFEDKGYLYLVTEYFIGYAVCAKEESCLIELMRKAVLMKPELEISSNRSQNQ